MGLEQVTQAVLAAAEQEASAMVEAARRESEAEISALREECRQKLDAAVHAAEASAKRETARLLGQARHEGRMRTLAAKNEAIDEAFARAKRSIAALGDKEFLAWMGSWVANLPADAGGVLHVSLRDKERFTKESLDQLNQGRQGNTCFTTVVADPQVENGFILEGADYSIDCTINRRLNTLRENIAGEVAVALFGQRAHERTHQR